MEVFSIRVGKRTQRQVPFEYIEPVEWKTVVLVIGFQQGRVFERVAQTKSAIVQEVVAQKSVAHAGLLGNCPQGRMRIYHAHGNQESVIRDAVQSDSAVAVRDIFGEPIDGVVGIGAFVHALGIAGIVNRPQHDKLPF